mgnify:CR=1 FL=1
MTGMGVTADGAPVPMVGGAEVSEPPERLPYIVIIIDELADMMMIVGKKVEELIARLAQKARASGVHMLLATHRLLVAGHREGGARPVHLAQWLPSAQLFLQSVPGHSGVWAT